MTPNTNCLKRFQSLYLNPNKADVWFIFEGKRIPSHKLVLSTVSEYYNTMFYGSLPVSDEVNMDESNVSVKSFEEFLKYMYFMKPNLTMENIEGVINMAKITLCDDIFGDCEAFLKKSINKDNSFIQYQLALLYEMNSLKTLCETETSIQIESIFKSKKFLEIPYVYLQEIVKNDSLACEEIEVFNACIAWAKAACQRNCLDPANMKHLRSQLGDLVYEIRFTSMKNEDATTCIESYSGLFTADELQEINCLVAKNDAFKFKKFKRFNRIPRYFNSDWNHTERLECSRFWAFVKGETGYSVDKYRDNTTRFICTRPIVMTAFKIELSTQNSEPLRIQINEINKQGHSIKFYSQETIAHFTEHHSNFHNSFSAEIQLNKWIVFRPYYNYDICIKFENKNGNIFVK